jgi:hypothetical protein
MFAASAAAEFAEVWFAPTTAAGEVAKAEALSELLNNGTGPLGWVAFCTVKNPNGSIDSRDWPTSNGLNTRDRTFTVPRVVDGVKS